MLWAARIMHVLGLTAAMFVALVMLYASRFWIWTAPWGEPGLLGSPILSPHGDVVRALTSNTLLADYDILIWGGGGIVVLSLVQWLASRIAR